MGGAGTSGVGDTWSYWPTYTNGGGFTKIAILFVDLCKIVFSVTNGLAIKDSGPFVWANCTESRGGPIGAIPSPPNPGNRITNHKNGVIGAKQTTQDTRTPHEILPNLREFV